MPSLQIAVLIKDWLFVEQVLCKLFRQLLKLTLVNIQ